MREKDVTQSNVMEIQTDGTKKDTTLVRAGICCRIILCSFPLPLDGPGQNTKQSKTGNRVGSFYPGDLIALYYLPRDIHYK